MKYSHEDDESELQTPQESKEKLNDYYFEPTNSNKAFLICSYKSPDNLDEHVVILYPMHLVFLYQT